MIACRKQRNETRWAGHREHRLVSAFFTSDRAYLSREWPARAAGLAAAQEPGVDFSVVRRAPGWALPSPFHETARRLCLAYPSNPNPIRARARLFPESNAELLLRRPPGRSPHPAIAGAAGRSALFTIADDRRGPRPAAFFSATCLVFPPAARKRTLFPRMRRLSEPLQFTSSIKQRTNQTRSHPKIQHAIPG